jgi:hypothetical protein
MITGISGSRKMKRTVIKYRDFGDRVEIVGVENAADTGNICNEFGVDVSDRYNKGYPWYNSIGCMYPSTKKQTVFFPDPGVPKEMSKRRFGELIKNMKAAGKRLQRIVREEREKEIKEVVI